MPSQEEIENYAAQIKMYASMLSDLADSKDYVVKFIENDNLDEYEQALRKLVRSSLTVF
jgi:predicted DNA-binding ArsR family transcriptional regulator